MPAITTLNIADGEIAPVTHVLSPDRIDSAGVAFYENRATGIVKKYETVSISNVRPKLDTGVRKVRVRMDLPYFDTVDTMLKLGSVGFDGTFLLPNSSTVQQRKNIRVMVSNLIASAFSASLVDTGESVY